MPIPKREAVAVLNALGAGVVPRAGLRHIAVGRLREITALKGDLEHIREGGATVRFIVGRFGSGKSFLLQLARANAFDNKFVVADADFSPERRLQGSGGQALALYRELMKNLSTQTRPDGNALPAIIERWISNVQAEVAAKQNLSAGSPEFAATVQASIVAIVNDMHELVHGFDFGTVVSKYYQGYVENNDDLKSNAIRWLRGEFSTKTEAREALGVRSIIDDDNFYDYLKVIARFAHDVGYAGLLICLDEAVNLYKITHSVARNANYEKILSVVNDCLQGRAGYVGFMFSGTPEFLEDARRGLFSYEALRTRLAGSRFATDDLRDFSGPVLSLPPLTAEEIYVLLQKVRDIHRESAANSKGLEDEAIVKYMEESLKRIGAKEFATPRDLVREFVNLLNLLGQYPDKTWQEILGTLPTPVTTTLAEQAAPASDGDPLDRFTDFKVQ
ncbi:MAG: ATP-binding protein [Chloroflexi bacterium]|nr:ATP-binding protein [Chloroflexota bacterium]